MKTLSNQSDKVSQLINVNRKQTALSRLLVATNIVLMIWFVVGAARPNIASSEPVDSIVFRAQNDTHWRISAIENALCFETKTKNSHTFEDTRKWHKVAQLYADEIHDRHAVRFDVGDFLDQKQDDDRSWLGVASMGIETNRMRSSPYFSAIRSEKGDGFPFANHPDVGVSIATLGFIGGGGPGAGIGGHVHGNWSFNPELHLKSDFNNWSASLHSPNSTKNPILELRADDKVRTVPTKNER